MEKLIEEVENLITEIENTDLVKDLKISKKEVLNDKEIINLVEKYNEYNDKNIKNKLYENEKFKKFKEQETKLNILIIEINSKLKKINNKGKCIK